MCQDSLVFCLKRYIRQPKIKKINCKLSNRWKLGPILFPSKYQTELDIKAPVSWNKQKKVAEMRLFFVHTIYTYFYFH